MSAALPLSTARRHSLPRPQLELVAAQPLPGIDTGYWLAHCEGFRVDGAEGRIGFVEEVRQPEDVTQEPLLAIRMGMLGRRVALVPAGAVQAIVPRAQRLWLQTTAAIVDTEPLA